MMCVDTHVFTWGMIVQGAAVRCVHEVPNSVRVVAVYSGRSNTHRTPAPLRASHVTDSVFIPQLPGILRLSSSIALVGLATVRAPLIIARSHFRNVEAMKLRPLVKCFVCIVLAVEDDGGRRWRDMEHVRC